MLGKSKSLLPVLLSSQPTGQVDPTRDFVVTGRERHIGPARENFLPYPQRSLRTKDFIYIINFEPDRWPAGDPQGMDDPDAEAYSYEDLSWNSIVCYPDLDAGPTKAYFIQHRKEIDVEPLYQLGFGKRPREELYDLTKDPDYMRNVAQDKAYAEVRAQMEERLLKILREQEDPRLVEEKCRFEHEPYGGFVPAYVTRDLPEGTPTPAWPEAYKKSLAVGTKNSLGSFNGSNQVESPWMRSGRSLGRGGHGRRQIAKISAVLLVSV